MFLNKTSVMGISVFLIIFGSLIFNMANAQSLPTRDEIKDEYKWNLKDFYSDEAKWEGDFTWVESQLTKFDEYKGKLSKSGDILYDYFKFSESVEKVFAQVMFYAYTAKDIDMNNGKYQSLNDKAMNLGSKLAATTSFVVPEILTIPEDKLNTFIKNTDGLEDYEHYLDMIVRMKPHTLDYEQEKMLAQLSPAFSSITQTYGVLNNAELPFPEIEGPDGENIRVSHGRYRAGLFSQDRNYRRDVYKGTYVPYNDLKGTFSNLFNGRVKQRIAMAEIKSYDSPLQAALYQNNIPVDVYENLIKSAHDNLDALHRWAKIKKRVLGLDEFHPYDTYVSLFPSVSKEYTYDEAKQICLNALAPLGEEYVAAVKKSFDNRWLDVYETKGKRSGAYSNSSGVGPHPVILINWNNTMDDLFTLIHEIGHNMHSYFTEMHQPQHYSGYSIFVAEVASITNEALLLDYLIKNAESKEEKLALIEKFLINAQMTFFRQTRFAEFEKIVHEKALQGEYLNADQLTELFAELYSKYWGDAMETDNEEGLSWARVHHFLHYDFYVYQYATGFAAAQALSEQILQEGKPAVDRYLKNFIYAGNSDYAIPVLKKAGVDMSSPEPVKATCEKINNYLDELERLLE